MDQREITARFEKANVIDPNYPAFDVVCQENVIVILESVDWLAILAHQIQFRPSLRFFREGYERRLIAGIDKRQCYTNPHTNSCPMQSGENLTNSYGKRRTPTARSRSTFIELTSSITVSRASRMLHYCDALQRCRYDADVEAFAPPEIRLAPVNRSNDCPHSSPIGERYEIILLDRVLLKAPRRERRGEHRCRLPVDAGDLSGLSLKTKDARALAHLR